MSGASRRGVARPSPRRRVAAAWSLEHAAARRDGRIGQVRCRQPSCADEAWHESFATPWMYPTAPRAKVRVQTVYSTAALCQRPRPPPVKAARSPKTRPRVRSAPTPEPSNDERLPPSALANSSPQNPIAHRERRATTKRWPSSQQLEQRAPRPSRGAVGCPPAPSTSYWHRAVPSANNPFGNH